MMVCTMQTVCHYVEGCWNIWSSLPAYIDFQSRLRQEDLHNTITAVTGIKALHDCCEQYTVMMGIIRQTSMSARCCASPDRGSRAAAVTKLLIRKKKPAGHQLAKGCWHCIAAVHKFTVMVVQTVCHYVEGCWETLVQPSGVH